MIISIRKLTDGDLESANEMLKLAFGNSTDRLSDLKLYRRLQPDGWFAAFENEHLVGTVGAIRYESFAHVGFMAVLPELQGQGIGRKLMEFILQSLEQHGIPLVTLDASQAGHYLYPKLGFRDELETIIFQRSIEAAAPVQSSPVEPILMQDLDELAQVDRTIFGADRHKVFQTLLEISPDRAFLRRGDNGRIEGYLFAQSNRIGPWVMLKPDHAQELLAAALTLQYRDAVSVVVPDECPAAAQLLLHSGFERTRAGWHMYRGDPKPADQRDKIFAQTSLGAG